MNKQEHERGSDSNSAPSSRRKGFTGIFSSWLTCLSRRHQGDEEDPSTAPAESVEKWTIVHGFLAVMGGLAIEMRDTDSKTNVTQRIINFFPTQEFTEVKWGRKGLTIHKGQRQRTRLTLTPKGLQSLKERGHEQLIPDLSENKIKDKSKGSAFAKTLVCIQASWFCVQCLTRFSQGLAISLLELNTFGHAICTLFIYALWWNKPLDIVEQETVLFHPSTDKDDLKQAELVANLCIGSKLGKKRSESDHLKFDGEMFAFPVHCDTTDESGCHIDLSGQPLTETPLSLVTFNGKYTPNVRRKFNMRKEHTVMLAPLYEALLRGRYNGNISKFYLNVKRSADILAVVNSPVQKKYTINLNGSQNEGDGKWDNIKLLSPNIWNPAKNRSPGSFHFGSSLTNSTSSTRMPHIVIKYHDIIRWHLSMDYAQHGSPELPKNLFTDRAHNLPRFQDYDRYIPLFVGLGVVGLIYGGLHCVAWNAPFTTSVEKILWRLSSITIAATGVLVACAFSWTRLPPFWQEPEGVYDIIDGFTAKPWSQSTVARWCVGATLSDTVENFIRNQPFYYDKNNRLLRMLGKVAIRLSSIPVYSVIVGGISFLYLLKVIFDLFTVSFMVLYVLARIYLVVISFINLAHLPDSAYQLPQWSRYVPHIG